MPPSGNPAFSRVLTPHRGSLAGRETVLDRRQGIPLAESYFDFFSVTTWYSGRVVADSTVQPTLATRTPNARSGSAHRPRRSATRSPRRARANRRTPCPQVFDREERPGSRAPFLVVSRFEDGKVAEDWEIFDTAEMRRQLEGGAPAGV